jgi:hypothetical protein
MDRRRCCRSWSVSHPRAGVPSAGVAGTYERGTARARRGANSSTTPVLHINEAYFAAAATSIDVAIRSAPLVMYWMVTCRPDTDPRPSTPPCAPVTFVWAVY